MTKYILVQWPDSQSLMEHPRFNECLLVQDIEGHDEVGSSAYMCPEDIYNEIIEKDKEIIEAIKNTSLEDFKEIIKSVCKDETHNQH